MISMSLNVDIDVTEVYDYVSVIHCLSTNISSALLKNRWQLNPNSKSTVLPTKLSH